MAIKTHVEDKTISTPLFIGLPRIRLLERNCHRQVISLRITRDVMHSFLTFKPSLSQLGKKHQIILHYTKYCSAVLPFFFFMLQ